MNIYGVDFEVQYKNALASIKGPNQVVISRYVEAKKNSAGARRLSKIIFSLRYFTETANIANLAETKQESVRRFFELQEKTGISSETLHSYKIILGGFYRWQHGNRQNMIMPPELEFLDGKRFKTVLKTGPVLTEDDARAMIDAALQLQHKALITLLFMGGGRVGEILMLTRKNIELEDASKQEFRIYIMQGKTGPRDIKVIDRWGYLGHYLSEFKGSPDSLLFTTRKGKPSYAWFRKMVLTAARRAGINKRVNFHWFRASCATMMGDKGMTGPIMNPYFGWKPGSEMASHYLHNNARAADSFISSLATKNADEFIRANLGELDNTASREKAKLFDEFGNYFLNKFGTLIVQKTLEGLQELEEIKGDGSLTSLPDASDRRYSQTITPTFLPLHSSSKCPKQAFFHARNLKNNLAV
ncbi:MAG: tyrosine-type recombinase/integrase [Candidatus Micrarchaeota archaeon]|nr:tyrosine-type recombinase/integrase [Candidatus Micrarchaeota archaeon]